MEKRYWKNKNVLITGGTSGLGKGLAIRLSGLGAKVAVIARRKELIDELVWEESKIFAIQGDIANKESIHSLAFQAKSYLGEIDVLFNIASYLGQSPLRNLMDTDCEDMEKVFETNLIGPFRLTKLIAPEMILRGKGVIVNISSDASVNPYPTWGSYSASKAANDHLTKIFDEELKDEGVRFLTVDPGDMYTPMHLAAIPEAKEEDLRDPNYSARLLSELIASEDFSVVRRSL